jgi:hypothetical protein
LENLEKYIEKAEKLAWVDTKVKTPLLLWLGWMKSTASVDKRYASEFEKTLMSQQEKRRKNNNIK